MHLQITKKSTLSHGASEINDLPQQMILEVKKSTMPFGYRF